MVPTYSYYGHEMKCRETPVTFPPQHQEEQPGLEYQMNPKPISDNPDYKASGKLKGKTAIVTGGDSGIGRAVAIGFAKEGADIVITFMPREREDADLTRKPFELAPAYIYLASDDSSFVTGQVLHVNGGIMTET